MTYTGKTTYAGKCLMLLALTFTVLTAAIQPQAAEVHKETFKLYPNPTLRELLWVRGHR